jgi:hypothetical protein
MGSISHYGRVTFHNFMNPPLRKPIPSIISDFVSKKHGTFSSILRFLGGKGAQESLHCKGKRVQKSKSHSVTPNSQTPDSKSVEGLLGKGELR